MIDELPWAMLPNGPAWTMTGVCSSVCSRLGFDRLAHDDGHRTGALQLLGRHRLAGLVVADDDAAEAGAQVGG